MTDIQPLSGEWKQDSVTGFLESKTHGTISPYHKTAFLKALKINGNHTEAAHKIGFSFRIIQQHLNYDSIFREAYQDTLLEMRHKLESELYKAGLGGKSKEALSWLSAHFPAEYGPVKKQQPKKEIDKDLDHLLDKI